MRKLIVRLISPWTTEVDAESALFSTRVSAAEAALLCEWAPTDELFTLPGQNAI